MLRFRPLLIAALFLYSVYCNPSISFATMHSAVDNGSYSTYTPGQNVTATHRITFTNGDSNSAIDFDADIRITAQGFGTTVASSRVEVTVPTTSDWQLASSSLIYNTPSTSAVWEVHVRSGFMYYGTYWNFQNWENPHTW